MLTYHKTTEEEKYTICGWKYEAAYSIYNNPPYAEQLMLHRGFANPKNSFYSFYDADKLVGYINLVEEDTEVFFGIGVAPTFCNRGYGQEICRLSRALSRQLYPEKPLYLEVRTWNLRAVRCYEKAGFRIAGEAIKKITPIGEGTFYRMTAD